MIKGFSVLVLLLVPFFVVVEFLDFDQAVHNKRAPRINAVVNLIVRFIIAGICLIVGLLLLVSK